MVHLERSATIPIQYSGCHPIPLSARARPAHCSVNVFTRSQTTTGRFRRSLYVGSITENLSLVGLDMVGARAQRARAATVKVESQGCARRRRLEHRTFRSQFCSNQ